MPINKSAKVRYDIIDECLRNTKIKWTKQRLLDQVNRRLALHNFSDATISISQIRYDLRDMEVELGAPIETKREGRSYYYYYEDEDYSINNIPVSKEDINTLNTAILLLQQFEQFSIVQDTVSVIHKLEAKLDDHNKVDANVIQFSYNFNQNTIETIEDLFQCIHQKNVLRVKYVTTDIKTYHIRPYILKVYDDNWYLLASCKECDELKVFNIKYLQHICVINQGDIPFVENASSYFNNRIGVSQRSDDPTIEHITMLLNGNAAMEVLTRPLHHSQNIIESDQEAGSVKISLDVIINKELIKKILTFGKEATVQEPKHLATEVRCTIKDAMNVYIKKAVFELSNHPINLHSYKNAV